MKTSKEIRSRSMALQEREFTSHTVVRPTICLLVVLMLFPNGFNMFQKIIYILVDVIEVNISSKEFCCFYVVAKENMLRTKF